MFSVKIPWSTILCKKSALGVIAICSFILMLTPSALAGSKGWKSYGAGIAAMEAGECLSAERYFKKAISLDPRDHKIRRGMFMDHYKPNAKLRELGPCPEEGGTVVALVPPKIKLLTPSSIQSEYPFAAKEVEIRWRITGGSGQFVATVNGDIAMANAAEVYSYYLPLKKGLNEVVLEAFDKEQKQSESEKLLLSRLDPTPLEIVLLSPSSKWQDYPFEKETVDISWRVLGGTGNYSVTVDGEQVEPVAGLYSASIPLAAGGNPVELLVIDPDLKQPERTELLLTRIEAPELSLQVDALASKINKDKIWVKGQVAGMVKDHTLTVNDAPVTVWGDGRFEYQAPLMLGKNELQIRLVDGLNRVKTVQHLVSRSENPLAGIEVGDYYALVIGNNDYQDPQISKLETPINDVRRVAQVLETDYGFKVTKLENATRKEILREFKRFRKELTGKDNFLLYYAGHGVLDTEEEEGYWFPVDAEKDMDDNWINNSKIVSSVKAMKAKHVMVVADACFAGSLTKTRALTLREKSPGYLKKLVKKKTRVVLTSGGEEPVADDGGRPGHSVFASAFLGAIENNDGILESEDLYSTVKKYVRNVKDQNPLHSPIPKTGHELGGDFLFIRKN